MHSTEIHCIISAIEWNLKLQVISIVLGGVSDFADKLSSVNVRLAALLALLLSLDQIAVIEVLVGLLGQARYLLLSHLPISGSPLHLSELTVVHLVRLDHELLVGLRHIRPVNNQIDVRLLGQLQIVNMVNILSLQIDSNNTLLTIEQLGLDAVTAAGVAKKSEDRKKSEGS